MDQKDLGFSIIPKAAHWKEGNILHPAVLYYEFQRIDITNKQRFLIENSNFYGINKIEINEVDIQNNIFRINTIECIFSDGTLFYKKFDKLSELFLDLNSLKNVNLAESYIYLSLPECSIKNFTFNEKDSRYRVGNEQILSDWNNQENHFLTLEENIFLHLDSHPPINCAYIPLTKIKIENGNIHFLDYIPPCLSIRANKSLFQVSTTLLEFLRKKLEILSEDINFIKNTENIISFIEKVQLNINLKHSISGIESLINLKSTTPELFYKECSSVLSSVNTINQINYLYETPEYQHTDIKYIFDNIISRIQNHLDQEISEKYRAYRFNKKDDMFYINFNQKLPDSIKISVKKAVNTKDEELIEWIKTALICEMSEVNFNREKRAIGYERKQEFSNTDIIVKKDYLIFSIQTIIIEKKSENIIVISQSNNALSKFEPEEIFLYQEKIT